MKTKHTPTPWEQDRQKIMNDKIKGRPLAPYGKTKALKVPVGCLAQVLLVIRQYKDSFKRKPDDEPVI